jgi:type IX secretion system PorP/SprF family membrane protein
MSALTYGQQDAHYTMYMMNPFVINPALAGTADYYQIRSNHRFQYMNFNDAPVTNSISAYGPDSRRPMGYGGTIFNDITGPTSRTGISGVYGYNVKVKSTIKVSGGLSLGLIQYKLDGTKITTDEDNDPALQNQVYTAFVPDASAGVYVWATDFYGGFSVNHILNSKIKLSSSSTQSQNRLKPHFYLVGGYMKDVSQGRKKMMWVIEPSLIVKKVVPASWQIETNMKVTYKQQFWGGLSFRSQDALSFLMGYTYKRQAYFAYSFDLALNDIRQYSAGSHEFVLGYNFAKIKKLKINSKKKK